MSRYDRQEKIFPIDYIKEQNVAIIGVGATGREVATTLATMGIPNITIIDFDVVEETNCTTQGYYEDDIGRPKVEATKEHMLRINSNINVTAINDRWRPNKNVEYTCVFMCVDSLSMREKLFTWFENRTPCILDARIGGEQIRILHVYDEESKKHFPTTIVDDGIAYMDGCHIPMIKFVPAIAAGNMVSQFKNNVMKRGLLYKDRFIALISGEMFDNV